MYLLKIVLSKYDYIDLIYFIVILKIKCYFKTDLLFLKSHLLNT